MAVETTSTQGRSGAGWWACRASRPRPDGPTSVQCSPGCAKSTARTKRLGSLQQVLNLSYGPPSQFLACNCLQTRLLCDGVVLQVTCKGSLSSHAALMAPASSCTAKQMRLTWASKQCWPTLAGPEPMVDAVVDCCHTHNDTVGLLGRPYLDVGKHTFSL